MKSFISTSIKKIRQAIDNNKLVIFVGAGVSANSKCPSWGNLINRFAEDLGLNKKNENNNSIEYYLKVPQYYYIERGRKEYFDVIDEVFNNVDSMPNDINKIIFKLKPCTIVTTNFDNLLEKTVKSEGLFYTTVKQDKELPYCRNDKIIIKMHGDGELKNIVLKEEDYLSYSRTFPLIENYLKSLFSTKTILFVGYGAEDPDFKLLFKWVKDQLDGNFQPAYLLEVNEEVDRINFNYYKDRGINILYYSEIEKDIENALGGNLKTNLAHPLGLRLLKFLEYIKEYDKYQNINPIKNAYNNLKVFEDMNAIFPEDILGEMKEKGTYNIYGQQELILPDDSELLDLLVECKNNIVVNKKIECEEELKKLLKILKKGGIHKISPLDHRVNIIDLDEDFKIYYEDKLNDDLADEFKELFYEFNYKKLTEKINIYNKGIDYVYGCENEWLKKAYYLYKLGKFVEAYEILKKISKESFTQHSYLYFFIAQFNMKQLRALIVFNTDLKSTNEEYYNSIIEEIDNIDVEKMYMELPEMYKKKVKFIRSLTTFNYFYKLSFELSQKIKEVRQQKRTRENGGHSFNNALIISYHKIINLMRYMEDNYIIIEHFEEIKSLFSIFIEEVFTILGIKVENGERKEIDKINDFLINIIIKYIKFKDLKNYIKDNDIQKIEVQENNDYILLVLDNILQNHSYLELVNLNVNGVISNIIYLLTYINLTKEETSKVINKLTLSLDIHILDGENLNLILNFFIRKFNKCRDTLELSCIIDFIEKYLVNFSSNNLNGFEQNQLLDNRFFSNLCAICNALNENGEKLYIQGFTQIIEKYNILSEIELLDQEKIIYNVIIPIFQLVNDETKEKILVLFNRLKTIIHNNKSKYFYFVYMMLIKDIINLNDEEQILFTREIASYITGKNTNEKQELYISIYYNFSEKQIMEFLLDLIRINKISYDVVKNECKDIINEYPMFNFFVDMKLFDYDKFDIEWLNYVREEDLAELVKNAGFRNIVIKMWLDIIKNKNLEIPYLNKMEVLLKEL